MLESRFAALLQSLGPFSASAHFAVALSGGADSLALTLLAQDYAAQYGGRVTALTVDHRLRAESAAEAQQVASMMRARGIAHHILTPTHDDASNNLQEAARSWRYQALSEYCSSNGVLHCLVAHNAGDNRETAHHNIERGDTADGASGMRSVRNLNGVRFLRPLLTIERGELEDYLRGRHVPWIDDPSNQNTKFARVRTRRMLQENPGERAALDATITHQRAARTRRDDALAHAAMRCVTLSPFGFVDIDLTAWRALDATVASQLLADCITTISGATSRPRGADTTRLVAALQHPFRTRTLQHCELTLQGDTLRIAREFARVAAPIALRGKGVALWDGRFTIHHDLPADARYRLAATGVSNGKNTGLPPATPALWHLDEPVFLPHIELPHQAGTPVRIGFTPPKPLAAAPFW